ncbi:746_t:CDS:1, partial [Acaulospora morrowiae]
MSLKTPPTSEEDFRTLITSNTDIDFLTASDSDSILLDASRKHPPNFKSASTNDLGYSSFDKNPGFDNRPSKRSSSFRRSRHSLIQQKYPNVGELLFDNGQIYSDVRLSFEDHGVLATRAGIPSELRLHSIVLFQSQFFKDQLSQTSAVASSSSTSNVLREKQIIVKLPTRVNEEDLVSFHCTLRLMYTKNWDHELADNLAKGVGCLSVCYEIGFHEGIEACWKWLVRKCNRDRNKEMMKRLIEAYPNLHEKYTSHVEASSSSTNLLEVPAQKSLSRTPSKRGPPLQRRSSRKSSRSSHLRRRTSSRGSGSFGSRPSSLALKPNQSDTSISSDASTSLTTQREDGHPIPFSSKSPSPVPRSPSTRPSNGELPSPPLSTSPSLSPVIPHFTSLQGNVANNGRLSPQSPPSPTKSLMSSHVKLPFPTLPPTPPPSQFGNVHLLNAWVSKFESYAISSRRSCARFPSEARQDDRCFPFLEHFASVFESIIKLGRSKQLTSPECLDYTLRMLNVIKVEHAHFHSLHMKQVHISPQIVLHRSLDAPLSILLREVLLPIEQRHLCDYLWAPSNVSNLMHLREIRSNDEDVMEEDEFDGLDQVMGEASLVRGSRVSSMEHMVVGEKMAKVMKEIMSH